MSPRSRVAVRACLLVLAVAVPVSPAVGATPSPSGAAPTADDLSGPSAANETTRSHINSVYPNPVAAEDRGEYVVVSVAPAAVGRHLTLSDGETDVRVPTNRTGRVLLTDAPANLSPDAPPGRVVSPGVQLANGGERLTLSLDGAAVDTVRYGDAPEGERFRPATGTWWPLGLPRRAVESSGPANATAFVLPDAPGVPVETLRTADARLLLAGYTLTSRRVADALVAAAARGVRVRVLVDGSPVGGRPAREANLLTRLREHGVAVRTVGGPAARVRFHHAKYAVVDDTALVLTENWKPAGTGGKSSRGWGVRVHSSALAADLASLFASDFAARDARPWRGGTGVEAPAADGQFPARLSPRAVSLRRVSLLTAPSNARTGVIDVVDDADSRVAVIQPTVAGPDSPFVRALVRAADRGVRVRLLVSSAWYVREDNERLVAWLNDYADREDVPLSARLADPNGRYEKIHAKGVVADDVAVVGSLNWNAVSATENREVALVLHSESAAAYYRRAFTADWRGGGWRPGVGDALLVVAALVLVVAVARRSIRFADEFE